MLHALAAICIVAVTHVDAWPAERAEGRLKRLNIPQKRLNIPQERLNIPQKIGCSGPLLRVQHPSADQACGAYRVRGSLHWGFSDAG